jgi:Ternary complex associated domain 9
MSQTVSKPVILVADDFEPDIERVERPLNKIGGYTVIRASSFDETCACLDQNHVVAAFVDVFFDTNNDQANGLEILKRYPHVPLILMSGQDGAESDRILRKYDDARLKVVSKDKELEERDNVDQLLRSRMARYYDLVLEIAFGKGVDFIGIANHLQAAPEALQPRAYELEMLVRAAFHDWDRSDSPHVRAASLRLESLIHTGDNSVVVLARPMAANGDAQSDVVIKFTRNDPDSQTAGEHTRFDKFKNVLGGFGLRERRYVRTANYHAQVYAVPYYEYKQTQTFREFFVSAQADNAGLDAIRSLTAHIFGQSLSHLNHRSRTGGPLDVHTYYRHKLGLDRRLTQMRNNLLQSAPPNGVQVAGDGSWLEFRLSGNMVRLPDPIHTVLEIQKYSQRHMTGERGLRHGDLHTANILVDADRLSTWYIDYADIDTEHFVLVDHIEMESSLLFSVSEFSPDLGFFASLVDAVSQPSHLCNIDRQVPEKTSSLPDQRAAKKLLAAIEVIRESANKWYVQDGSPAPYYHGLMFEALRSIGGRSRTKQQAWQAMLAAAILLSKL